MLLVGPTHPFRGGIAHHTTLLHRALSRRHETTFVSFRRQYIAWMYPGASDRDDSEAPLAAEGVRHELDVLRPLGFVALGRRAAAYDAVLMPWWVAVWAPWYALFLAGLRGRAPVIFVCHNVIEHESGAAKRALTAAVLRRGDGFLVQSRDEAGRLEGIVGGAAPIEVAPHPSYDVFDAGRFDRASARAHLELPDDAEVVLFFGFVRPYKGLEHLLEAFATLSRSRPRAHLLVVGECWKGEDDYRALVRRLGLERCRLVFEYVANEEVEAYVKAADVVALPYLSGTGSGIAQLALGMNVPVVATRIAAFEDVVADGETGCLVPPGDAGALAEGIARLLDPAQREQVRAAIGEHKVRFSWDALVDRIDAVLSELGVSGASAAASSRGR